MKLTQLNRFTGLLAAAAIGFIVAPPSSTAQDGPESVVSTPIKALEEKNPKLLWDMLPASYQTRHHCARPRLTWSSRSCISCASECRSYSCS